MCSPAGSDIIGEDPSTGKAELSGLVAEYNGNINDVEGHINRPALAARLAELQTAYKRVIDTFRADNSFRKLQIIIHGYDVPYPFPWGANDKCRPMYLVGKHDKWLGSVFAEKGIPSYPLGRAILKELIDAIYRMLHQLAENSRQSHVWVVNSRGALPEPSDWKDEIHGTSKGYASVFGRFIGALNRAIAHAEGSSS